MNTSRIKALVVVLAIATLWLVPLSVVKAQTPKSPELKVLDRMVGSFRMEIVERQANGDEEENTATGVGKRSLQAQYLDFRITESDGKEAILHLFTYDSAAGVYNMWSFVPDSPKPTLTTCQWDESEKTLTGQMDMGAGSTMQMATHFITNDRWEYAVTTKDASGNVLGEMKGKAFRQNAKVKGIDPTGIYTLITVNGSEVPTAIFHGDVEVQVYSGIFTINTDGTCNSKVNFGAPSGEDQLTRNVKATYTRAGSVLTMQWEGAGMTMGTVDGVTFTMDNGGMTFVYRRVGDS